MDNVVTDNVVPDTLVLKIQEEENCTLSDEVVYDTTLYVFYDTRTCNFVIRGKRRNTPRLTSPPYSFECESATDLADFIRFVICSENKVSYTLYNYDNLHTNSNEITYDFLHSCDDVEYEIVGYDNQKLCKEKLENILRMLRNVFNYY